MADATAGDVGEFGLIARVVERIGTSEHVLLGPGDDAAVVAAPDGRVVATTDVLVEDVHFRRDWSTGYDVGRKAAAANLADVAAMGGRPTALLVALVAPADLPVAWVLALADGLRDEAARCGASVVGGDTARGERVVVSVTALGDLAGREPVRRSGARAGDVLVHVGRLGWSAGGLALLQRADPDALQRFPDVVAAHLRPEPPHDAGPALAGLGATAMCDVSDGAVADLGHVLTASGVGAALSDLPDDPRLTALAAELGVDETGWQLHGGEDHGLLAAVPPAALPAARALGAVPLGECVAGEPVVRWRGAVVDPAGWRHFS